MAHMFYGYVPKEEWLVTYGVKKKLGNTKTEWQRSCTILNAALDIFERAGLAGHSKLPLVWADGEMRSCLAIGSNDLLDQLPMPTPEQVQRLKDVLGTEREPSWFVYA
ncbi:hypothetical protein EW146_g5191 [Bondarzewia mesenterica]|uniref:Uncharacterized protein n=1 Tax=Bondarzewia mesenterica TaxID=1095465 RepID=A0A4S4LUB4_9AGAM|nr:hypothetical protein EW146_g5191 [Bondarzewia mesenterica]